jgi:heme exporter protein D
MSVSEFFNMGGYGFYVWTSYGLALVLMVAAFIPSILQERKLIQRISRRIRREQREES